MKHLPPVGRPEWLSADAARAIAEAAGAVVARRDSPKDAKAAVRAAAAAFLPALPAPMLAEVAAAVAPAEAPAPDEPTTGLVTADANTLAQRLGFLAVEQSSAVQTKLAKRLAAEGARRIATE